MTNTPEIVLPDEIRPKDGRFGSGPSRVRPEGIAALAAEAPNLMGTSHRQAPVRFLVSRLRNGLAEMFSLPDGHEVILGNGGTTIFWDAALFGLIDSRSQHLDFGEFSGKFAKAVATAPHLAGPDIITVDPGTRPSPVAVAGIDAYALTHNETTTGVFMPIERPQGADDGALVLVDATSAAGGIRFDPSESDCYYFAPQKVLGSDGGLWIAAVSPAAIERIESIAASDRWIPQSLNLKTALDNSRKDQTNNTPALATIFLAVELVEWINENGGMEFAAGRCDSSAATLYGWAEASDFATPFVEIPEHRSTTVATIDLDDRLAADTVNAVLRANGIVDTSGYRKLGRNQLRIAMFPAIDPSDIEAFTMCLDYIAERI
ncbi:MAG: phosphoserine transaminase [Acidimicrobiales bacterium]